jgi:hypothetical protein
VQQALGSCAKLANPLQTKTKTETKNRLSKAQMRGLADLISDFFNSIGQIRPFDGIGRLMATMQSLKIRG